MSHAAWQDYGQELYVQDPLVPALTAMTGWGTLHGPEAYVRPLNALEMHKVEGAKRVRVKGMSGEHVLVELDGHQCWVDVASFHFAAPLLNRTWTIISPGHCDWRFMAWNVLADGLAQSQFTDRLEHLDWAVRRELLLDEVDRVRPDVLALAELNHYPSWRKEMASRGYHGTWVAKPKSPCLRYGAPADGCAVFVSGRFDTIENLSFTFPDSNQVCAALLLRDRVLQLDCIVAVVHLKAGGEEHGPARLRQVQELIRHANAWQLARSSRSGRYQPTPIILAGDFNEQPGLSVSSELATHEYQSLYDDLGLEFTAMDYTWNFEGVLDYVFAKHLLAKRALGVPSREEIGAAGVPNERYPSDHFALAVDLAYSPELRMSAEY
jgi:mRNA deadenylase 3'-5' endonuclease subunit Ccr4